MKAEYMEDYVGEGYDAVVSSVVKFGLFVELPIQFEFDPYYQSPKFYYFNERDLTLRGEKSGSDLPCRSANPDQGERADKMTGGIDFSYIPSEWDIVEKASRLKDVTEMAPQGSQTQRQKKFLRDQPLEEMTNGKILHLNPKEKRGRNHFTKE